MLRLNFKLGLVLLFGWLAADSVCSILGAPLEGIYYPLASGRLKTEFVDWTAKTWYSAPVYLAAFACLWFVIIQRAQTNKGLRAASLITAFVMAPFWIVSSVTMDMYNLELNGYWLASMIYANIAFLLHAFLGDGSHDDLVF
jgi:hypothetical protein